VCWFALAASALGQSTTVVVGQPDGPVRIESIDWWTASQPVTTVLLDQVLLRDLGSTTRTASERGELHRMRRLVIDGTARFEGPDGTRVVAFERTTHTGHGLLFVPANGAARVAYEGTHQLDMPMSTSPDGRHLVFARGNQLTIVRLDGSSFPGGGSVRTVATNDDILAESVVCGNTTAFWVTGDDRVQRAPLAAGPVHDLTPAGNSSGAPKQSKVLALSGDGNTIAFLRGDFTDLFAVWVAGTSGPSRKIAMPERNYREAEYLPAGSGQPHLLLNHDGSRLMVTEIATEDELHVVDTGIGGDAMQVTADANFAEYIGVHILPSFRGDRLLFASGHEGWMDWYALQPSGEIRNLTQTGSPDPQFLLGAIAVDERFTLAGERHLATETVGATKLVRLLDATGGSWPLFADLITSPTPGRAIGFAPDVLVEGAGGDRIVSGASGAPILATPTGIHLTTPVRGPHGILATFVHLDVGLGVLVLLFGDGGPLFVGDLAAETPRLSWTAAGELAVLWSNRVELLSVQGGRVLPLPAAERRLLSGAGN